MCHALRVFPGGDLVDGLPPVVHTPAPAFLAPIAPATFHDLRPFKFKYLASLLSEFDKASNLPSYANYLDSV